MTAGQQRKAQRRVHLAAALLLIAYVYAPLETQLQDVVRFLVLPALVVTGIAMWQAPRIRRLRKRLGATRLALSPTAPPAKPGHERGELT
jgi:thiosulfate reductase cytochrome b subunit